MTKPKTYGEFAYEMSKTDEGKKHNMLVWFVDALSKYGLDTEEKIDEFVSESHRHIPSPGKLR